MELNSINISINGIDLFEELSDISNLYRDYFIVNSVEGRRLSGLESTLTSVEGMDGAHVTEVTKPVRPLFIRITIKAPDRSRLNKKIERFNEIINDREGLEIRFDDEGDRLYFGVLDSVNDEIESGNIYQASISIECVDPFKYSDEKTLELPADISTVDVEGTAPTEPVFELTAKEKATFAMVSNGLEENAKYNIIGVPADVDAELVDSKIPVFVEYGETLSEWTAQGSEFDNGKVTGDQLGFDGTGIHPLSYGDPGSWDKWYGPALMREINPIQDFEVEMRLRVNTNSPRELYRIEFYLYDENMQEL